MMDKQNDGMVNTKEERKKKDTIRIQGQFNNHKANK